MATPFGPLQLRAASYNRRVATTHLEVIDAERSARDADRSHRRCATP